MKARIVVAAIIEKDGKYLFGKKPKDVGPYPNTLHLLGGGVDIENESMEEAIKREVQEEGNITVKIVERVSFDEAYAKNKHNEDVHYIFHVYMTVYTGGEAKPGDDITELVWLSKEAIKTAPLSTPSIKLFTELGWR